MWQISDMWRIFDFLLYTWPSTDDVVGHRPSSLNIPPARVRVWYKLDVTC